MGASNILSSLNCEVNILRAKNMESISAGKLFVRYYLSSGAGKSKRVELNTREISSNSQLVWNESFSLECLGTEESLNELKKLSVIFELRWRSTVPVLGKLGRSRLLGKGEASWKSVFESENMGMEKWVKMVPKNDCILEGVKPPYLEVAMKVQAPTKVEVKKKYSNWERCGCKHSCNDRCSYIDYDLFALGVALEGF